MEFCLLLGGFLRGKVGVFVATLHIVVLLVMPATVNQWSIVCTGSIAYWHVLPVPVRLAACLSDESSDGHSIRGLRR